MRIYFFYFFLAFYIQLLGQSEPYELPLALLDEQRYEELIPCAEEAAEIYLQRKDDTLYYYCHALIFNALDKMKRKETFLSYKEKILASYQAKEYSTKAIKNLGLAYQAAGDYDSAQRYFSMAFEEVQILQKNPAYQSEIPNWSAEIYNDIGTFYYALSDYEQALLYYNFTLTALQKQQNKTEIAKCYFNKGTTFHDKKDYQNAIMSFHLAKRDASKSQQKDVYIELINTYLLLEKIDSASFYLEKLAPFMAEIKDNNEKGRYEKFSAQVSYAKADYPSAYTHVKRSLSLRKNRDGIIQSWHLLAKIQYKLGKLDSAICALHTAMQYTTFDTLSRCLCPTNNSMRPTNNSIRPTNNLPATTHIVFKKATIPILTDLITYYIEQKNYEKGIAICDSADNIITNLRELLETEEAKLFLSDKVKELYEKGIEAAFALYEQKKDEKWTNTAFYYAEKCKAILLLEGVKQKQALLSATLSENDRLTLQRLQMQLKRYEKSVESLNAEKNYQKFLQTIEQNYPEYAQFALPKMSNMQAIQAKLADNQLLIAYFWGKQRQYCFVVEKEKTPLFYSLHAQKDKLASLLSAIENKEENYLPIATAVYKELLPPFLQENTTQRWLVIPDGFLTQLPFEVLSNSPQKEHLLLYQHAFSYSYSATMWANSPKSYKSKQDLAVIPAYQEYQKYLPNIADLSENEFKQMLPSSTQIVAKKAEIQSLFATNAAQNYHNIYFYTHSFSDSLSQNCRIALADTFLSLNEIYPLQIPADLLILASCESGVGKWYEGEGVMSLARGFIHAGCRAVMPTLWEVDAKSIRDILHNFQQNTANGDEKDVALQKAKIVFLSEKEENQFPVLWAAQVLIGDVETSVSFWLRNRMIVTVCILCVLLGLGGMIALIRKRYK